LGFAGIAELPSALWQLAQTAPNLAAPALRSGLATLAAAGAAAFAGSSLARATPERSDVETMRAASNFMAQKE